MRKEEIGLRCKDDYFKKVLLVAFAIQITLKVKGAQLWNEKFEIISKHTLEIRIDSALLEVLDGTLLVRIHSHHGLCYEQCCIFLRPFVQVEPLSKPIYKCLLRDSLRFLTANTTAEQVVKTATASEQTSYGKNGIS